MKRANKRYQCYYCNKFFIRSDKHQGHINNCLGAPGVVYSFNNQNLISYQDNFHAKDDIPFVNYFNFEKTAPTDNCFDPEQKKNVCCFLCHDYRFSSRIKTKSYCNPKKYCNPHSLEELASLNYFTQEQINFIDHTLLKILKDMAFDVSKRKCKNNMRQMFCIESALVKKIILKWFKKKF